MKQKDIWILNCCVPSSWTVNLTPPEGDWDRECEPGSEEEKEFKRERIAAEVVDIQSFLASVGKGLSDYVTVIGKGFTALYEKVAEDFKAVNDILEDSPLSEVQEQELKQHGTHIIKSQNPKVILPKRTINTGPPAPRLDKRRK